MLRQFFIISLLFNILFSANSFSEDIKSRRIKGPITIVSETLTSDNNNHTALFEKNVIAKTSDMTLYADKMLVYYDEKTNKVTKIDATGNVKLNNKTSVITSQKAIYFSDEDKAVFTGEPRAVDGENIITGTKLTVFLTDNRTYVEKSKVFLKNKQEM